jgi:predicted RNase H-like HicB family nuclease
VNDYHINVFYSEDDGGYIADIPDLEACSAFGEIPEQAVADVLRAKEVWLAVAAEAHRDIPSRAIDRPATSAETSSSCCRLSAASRFSDRRGEWLHPAGDLRRSHRAPG